MAYSKALASLGALGDPTRRRVFERVAAGPATVGAIARGLPVSRPAVSQHLKVLRQAGLVYETAVGTRRIYHLDPRGIASVRSYLEARWNESLAAFKEFADQAAEESTS